MIAGPDIARQPDGAPDLRLAAAGFEAVFGRLPACVASSPGGLTLFGGSGQRFALAVPVRWGAVVAVDNRPDDLVELRSNNRPGVELDVRLDSLADAPAWAGPALAPLVGLAGGGVSVLVGTALPEGCGVPTASAVVMAVAEAVGALRGRQSAVAAWPSVGDVPGQLAAAWCPDGAALLVDEWGHSAEALPFDLVAEGLRLMIVECGPTSDGDIEVDADVDDEDAAAAGPAADLRRGDVRAVGRWLDRARAGVPDEILRVAAAARGAGALGAGVVPGGGLVTLVPEASLGPVRTAVVAAWPGERRPRFLTATATRAGRDLIGAASSMHW